MLSNIDIAHPPTHQIAEKTERCIATPNDTRLYTYLHNAKMDARMTLHTYLLYKYFNSQCLFLCLFPFKGNFQCGRLCFLAHSSLVWPRYMWRVNFVYYFMHLFMSVCRYRTGGGKSPNQLTVEEMRSFVRQLYNLPCSLTQAPLLKVTGTHTCTHSRV